MGEVGVIVGESVVGLDVGVADGCVDGLGLGLFDGK